MLRTQSYYTRPYNGLPAYLQRVTHRLAILPYSVESDGAAAGTVPDLIRAYGDRRRLSIWHGASEGTPWGDRAGNWLFRAWHDTCHYATRIGFTVPEEITLCAWQIADARTRAGLGDLAAAIVHSEIAGQALYFLEHGQYLPEGSHADFARRSIPADAR